MHQDPNASHSEVNEVASPATGPSSSLGSSTFAGLIHQVIDQKFADWELGLEQQGIAKPEFILSGSLASGHFSTPKPRTSSYSPEVPAEFSTIVEVDTYLTLDPHEDPCDPLVIAKIERATGGKFSESTEVTFWGAPMRVSFFYAYEGVGDTGVGLEWELCVTNKPFLEITDYWAIAFTPEETSWQKQIREHLKKIGADYKDEIVPIKALQCDECRWRVVGLHAHGEFLKSQSAQIDTQCGPSNATAQISVDAGHTPPPEFQQLTEVPAAIREAVDQWLAGEADIRYLTREANPLATLSDERLMQIKETAPEISTIPPPPAWVVALAEFQEKIKKEKQSDI